MAMKVEAALVTQKRADAEFNSDSVNINGKVLSREIILKGYKGSGIMSGSVYFALTSSPVDGFADAAVAAFNDRAVEFEFPSADSGEIIKEYFEDCKAALADMNHSPEDLRAAVFQACGRKAVLANSGNTGLYLISDGKFSPVATDSKYDGFGICSFPDVKEGDIFILTGPGIGEVLTDKDIEDICKIADGNVKKIASLISKVALAKDGKSAASIIVISVQEISLDTEKISAGFVPDMSVLGIEKENKPEETAAEEEKEATPSELFEQQHDENAGIPMTQEENKAEDIPLSVKEEEKDDEDFRFLESVDPVEDDREEDVFEEENDGEEEKTKEKKDISPTVKKLLFVLLFFVITAVAAWATVHFLGSGNVDMTESAEDAIADEVSDEQVLSGEAEPTEEAGTVSDETTSSAETTTGKKTEITSRVTTTVKAETTTKKAETTTAKQETTTLKEETTTAVQETTTEKQEETTAEETSAEETTSAAVSTSASSQAEASASELV